MRLPCLVCLTLTGSLSPRQRWRSCWEDFFFFVFLFFGQLARDNRRMICSFRRLLQPYGLILWSWSLCNTSLCLSRSLFPRAFVCFGFLRLFFWSGRSGLILSVWFYVLCLVSVFYVCVRYLCFFEAFWSGRASFSSSGNLVGSVCLSEIRIASEGKCCLMRKLMESLSHCMFLFLMWYI